MLAKLANSFLIKLIHLLRIFIYSGKNVLNQKTELQKALQKQKERISQSHNREDHSSSSTNQGLGQELAQEIARRNVRNIEGNSSKADESEALNEEYLRIKSSLKHNRINSSDI